MKILKARHAGFCYGVQRATRIAWELESQGIRPIYTLGPLMHNPQEVLRLTQRGIIPRDRIDDCVGGKTLIRTHGIGKEEVERAKFLGVDLVDTTCPHVKIPRHHIEEFGRQRRVVFLVGDQGHPEVQAILSYATGPVVVVCKPGDVPEHRADTPVGVVAQTTQSKETFERVVAAARSRYTDTVAVCTVCEDTERRQEEGKRLARQSDVMVVVGGRNSANTCRLAELCRAIQPRTYHIECARELGGISFGGVEKTGITSGASTPDWVFDEVYACLARLG